MRGTTLIWSRNIAVHRLLEIIFDSRMIVIDLNGLKSNLINYGAFFLRYVELCMKYVDVLLANAVRPIVVLMDFSWVVY